MALKIRYFIKVVIARAYVRVIGAQRELSWVVGDTLLPFLTVAAYVFVYRAMNAPQEYTGFVILGGLLMTFWLHMVWTMGMQFFWEKEMGNLARYLMTPMPRPALLLGMALGGMVMTSTRALIIYIASRVFFRVEFNVAEPWMAFGVFIVTMIALYGMGMTLSSLFFIAGRGVNNSLQILHEPVFFLGGFYFPVRQLGFFVAGAAAALIPTTLGLDALRQTMLGAYHTGLLSPATEMILLLIMGVVFVVISVIAIGKMEDLGRKHGKLTLEQQ